MKSDEKCVDSMGSQPGVALPGTSATRTVCTKSMTLETQSPKTTSVRLNLGVTYSQQLFIIFTSLHPDIQNWMKLNFELSHTEQSGSGASGLVRQHNGLVRKQKGLVWKLHGTRTKGRDQEPKRLVLVSAATFLDSQC
jgi:hypothetical protein